MEKTLLDFLRQIPDPRRSQGQRYPLEFLIIMMLMGTISGRVGYRSVSRFGKQHEKVLIKLFGLKHGLPSHVTLSTVMEQVDLKALEKSLLQWSKGQVKPRRGMRIALDGKSIKSSVKDGTSRQQNFVAFVNAFCHDQGLVLGALSYENKQGSEIQKVRELVKLLGLEGAIFTLDAYHDSKKH